MSLALLQTALYLPAEFMLNQLLSLDAASTKRLEQLEGRTLALYIKQPELKIFISIRNHSLHLSPLFEGDPDASLRGSARSLLAILLQQTPVTNLAPYQVELQGSTAFVQDLQNLLKELNVDWEFHLSRIIGDLPVAGIRHTLDNSSAYASKTGKSLLDNIQEFVTYESDAIASKVAAEQFYAEIAELTLRVDRLQAKISNLQNQFNG